MPQVQPDTRHHAADSADESAPPPLRWNLDGALAWLLGGFVGLACVSALALYYFSRAAAGNELTLDRARFMAINALTCSGFQTSIGVNALPEACQLLVFFLTLVGAIFPMIVGGLAIVRILRLDYSDPYVARSAVLVAMVLTVVGAIPLIESGRTPFHAMMLSASAFGNSGLYLGGLPPMTGWQTQVVLLPLAVLGSLGLPVLMQCYDALLRRGRLSAHSRTVLAMTAAIYLVLTAVLMVAHLPIGDSATALPAAASSSTAAVNARTLGLPFEYAQEWPAAMQWIVLLGMLVGGSPGGTAGGLKTTTLVVLAKGTLRSLRGQAPGRAYGMAVAFTGAYLLLIVAAFVVLTATESQLAASRLFFETASAVGNVGLSFDPVTMVTPGLDVLGAAALLGRLLPLLVLWWMARSTTGADLAVG